jgi:DNA-binding NarL/FixJ family response regulator
VHVGDLGIVILTGRDEDDVLFRALETGASAFVAKSAPVEEVLGLLRDGLSVPAIAALMAAVEYGMFVSEPQMSRSAQNGTAPAATAS